MSALEDIIDDNEQNSVTRHEVNCLLSALETLETVIMIDMWHSVLTRFNAASEKLQSAKCELKIALDLLCSLFNFLKAMRDR